MSRRGRMTAVVAAVLVVGSIGAGGVMAASQSGDEAALQTVQRGDGGRNVERRVDELLRKMTLDEKLQQLTLLSDGQMKAARRGAQAASAASSA